MDLDTYANYPLPANVRTAFGVQTAQQLADQLGVSGTLTPELAHDAESAYKAYRAGDSTPARTFLHDRLGLSDETVSSALSKLRS